MKRKSEISKRISALLSAGILTLLGATIASPVAQAAARYWDNNGGTANYWTSAANWSDVVGGGGTGTIPNAFDTANFSATPIQGNAQTVQMRTNPDLGWLKVLSGVTANTALTGGNGNYTITLWGEGAAIVNDSNSRFTIGSGTSGQNVHIELTKNQSIAANGSGNINIVNNVSSRIIGEEGNWTLTNNGTGSGTVSMGTLQSSMGKIVQDSATSQLNLRANNSAFTRGVEIRKGTLLIGTYNNNLGTADSTVTLGNAAGGSDAATLTLWDDTVNPTYPNPISLAGNTTGILKIILSANSHTFTGGVTGNNGLTLESGAAGVLTFSTGAINNAGTINHTGAGAGDLTINSVIGANVTGLIQNSATSKMVLKGANTYSGDTTISAGTLKLDGSGSLANTANIIVASGAGFDVSTPTTALTLGSGQTLKASATGADTTATLTVGSGKNLTLGGTVAGLAFTAYGGGATPPLTVAGSAGSLDLNGKPVTVTTTTALAVGTYKLLAKSGSATVTGTPGTLTVNGSGTASGTTASLSVSGDELNLVVASSGATYTITYDGNGNTSGTAPADQTKIEDVTLTLATQGDLAKDGHAFAGWNTQADGLGTDYAEGASYTDNAALTLYAKWTAATTYAITYDDNDADSGTVPADQTKVENVTLALASNSGNLVKAGHTFAGWNTQADGNGTSYAEGGDYTANAAATLYAKWTINSYTVTYDGNGRDGGSVPVDGGSPYTYNTTVTVLGNTGSLTRTGHTFTNWNTAANGSGTSYAPAATFAIAANTTLYAQWAPDTYPVSYSANGATSGTAPGNQTKTYGVSLTLAAQGDLAKAGYLFAGWNTAADRSGTGYTAGGPYTNNAAATLYAQWVTTVTETFDTAATTAAHGWTGNGNTSGGNNFGWSNTGNVLGTAGEAGGTFARSASYRTFADTTIGTFGRTRTLRMLGSFKLNNSDFDGSFYLGYFNPAQGSTNFVGIQINEPSGSASDPFRGWAVVNGTGGAGTSVINLAQNTTLSFDLTWVGNADGSGTLSGTVAGTSVSVTVGAGAANFTAFGLLCGGMSDNNTAQNTGGCYFDDLTYTRILRGTMIRIH
jgi:uncharacterized repeat protein (TIGR02543 family)